MSKQKIEKLKQDWESNGEMIIACLLKINQLCDAFNSLNKEESEKIDKELDEFVQDTPKKEVDIHCGGCGSVTKIKLGEEAAKCKNKNCRFFTPKVEEESWEETYRGKYTIQFIKNGDLRVLPIQLYDFILHREKERLVEKMDEEISKNFHTANNPDGGGIHEGLVKAKRIIQEN